jgi:hypothetical protein
MNRTAIRHLQRFGGLEELGVDRRFCGCRGSDRFGSGCRGRSGFGFGLERCREVLVQLVVVTESIEESRGSIGASDLDRSRHDLSLDSNLSRDDSSSGLFNRQLSGVVLGSRV